MKKIWVAYHYDEKLGDCMILTKSEEAVKNIISKAKRPIKFEEIEIDTKVYNVIHETVYQQL